LVFRRLAFVAGAWTIPSLRAFVLETSNLTVMKSVGVSYHTTLMVVKPDVTVRFACFHAFEDHFAPNCDLENVLQAYPPLR
jgi:hypothetical protein